MMSRETLRRVGEPSAVLPLTPFPISSTPPSLLTATDKNQDSPGSQMLVPEGDLALQLLSGPAPTATAGCPSCHSSRTAASGRHRELNGPLELPCHGTKGDGDASRLCGRAGEVELLPGHWEMHCGRREELGSLGAQGRPLPWGVGPARQWAAERARTEPYHERICTRRGSLAGCRLRKMHDMPVA